MTCHRNEGTFPGAQLFWYVLRNSLILLKRNSFDIRNVSETLKSHVNFPEESNIIGLFYVIC